MHRAHVIDAPLPSPSEKKLTITKKNSLGNNEEMPRLIENAVLRHGINE